MEAETEKTLNKTVMITGVDGYIGNALKNWLQKKGYCVTGVDTRQVKPEEIDMTDCDTIVHVAGIAHQKETKENAHLYYEINRDYAVKTALNARKSGVGQFIVLSSMSVYGKNTGCITKDTKPAPNTHYGRSKYQADLRFEKLCSDEFKVCILRPPMVYGKGCKGNYQMLRKLALLTPIFPAWKNRRSMIYIDYLCDFIEGLIRKEETGLFFPQNQEYVCTADMVRYIAAEHGHKVGFVKVFSPILRLPILPYRDKVFGSLVYGCKEDRCGEKGDFAKTIRETER